MQGYLVLDYETRSKCDLRTCGASIYSFDPSTEILCVAWRFSPTKQGLADVPTRIWSPKLSSECPEEFKRAVLSPSVFLVAHNANFEQWITRNVLGRTLPGVSHLPHARWICTAAMSRAVALPASLEGVCAALKLPQQKDDEGHRLMMQMCKPRKPTKTDASLWRESAADIKRLMEYCVKDIDAEVGLFLVLPELSPAERKVWELDQKINFRGYNTDRELVSKCLSMIEQETTTLNNNALDLSLGLLDSFNQRGATLELLKSMGCDLPDLTAATVNAALSSGKYSGDVVSVLLARKACSKSSTAKYDALWKRGSVDGRVRDNLIYHGATTGRWSGAGVQIQNLPRPSIKDTDQLASVLLQGDLEMVRMLYGNPMDAMSSALRSTIIPTKGKVFYCADFASIEVRVLFWLAKHERGLNAYRQGKDLYKALAATIHNTQEVSVTKDQRNLGKAAILGCISKGTLTRTSKGAKKIEEINETDLLWNGVKWVKSGGAVARGLKGVIRIERLGIELTPDHWIWGGGMWQTSVEIDSEEDTLLSSKELYLAGSSPCPMSSISGLNAVSLSAAYAELKKNSEWIIFGEVKECFSEVVRQVLRVKKEGTPIETQISLLMQNLESVGVLVSQILKIDVKNLVAKTMRGMVVAELKTPSHPYGVFWNTLLHCMGLISGGSRWTELITIGVMSPEIYESLAKKKIIKIDETFDIVGVPTTHSFLLDCGALAHNCGYGMGASKFLTTCQNWGMKIDEELAQAAVTAYRTEHHPVVQLWGNLERAAISAVQNFGKVYRVNRTAWWLEGGFLWCMLPSGRKLAYYQPEVRFEKPKWGGEAAPKLYILSEGLNKKFYHQGVWGGVLTENVVQAVARDLCAEALTRIEDAGYEVVISVHDEILAEATPSFGSVSEFERLMSALPPWAEGCPVSAEGWRGTRYRK